jgi:excisionase family DNA binding protein
LKLRSYGAAQITAEPKEERMTATEMIDSGFATVKEAAAYMRVSTAQVYRMLDNGELPHAKCGRAAKRIPWLALRGYLARQLGG